MYAELQSQINDPVAIAENNITVLQNSLVDRVLKLCDILRYEFIFCRPCQELEDIVLETIYKFTDKGIISKQEVCSVYFDKQLNIFPRINIKTKNDFDRKHTSKMNFGVKDTPKILMTVRMKNMRENEKSATLNIK